jgi:hypothetical protein
MLAIDCTEVLDSSPVVGLQQDVVPASDVLNQALDSEVGQTTSYLGRICPFLAEEAHKLLTTRWPAVEHREAFHGFVDCLSSSASHQSISSIEKRSDGSVVSVDLVV